MIQLAAGLLALVFTLVAGPAFAEKRVALVIGNADYKNVGKLTNPANDAAAVANLFKKVGFEVESKRNLGVSELKRAVRDFADATRDADIAVVYYAGHGIEVDGGNYLVPVDATLDRDVDVEDETVPLDRFLRVLEPAKRLRLVILDACRDNPFQKTMKRSLGTRSVGRGLAKVEPTSSDTLIAFAAKAGSTASDGSGANSPFATALVNNLATPGLDLRIALGRVRDDVLKTTGNKQEPFVYGSLGGATVSLVPAAPEPKPVAAPAPAVTPPPAAAAPAGDQTADMRRDYELAAQIATKEAWESFLAVHTKGLHADLARAALSKINSIEKSQAEKAAADAKLETERAAAQAKTAAAEKAKADADAAAQAKALEKAIAEAEARAKATIEAERAKLAAEREKDRAAQQANDRVAALAPAPAPQPVPAKPDPKLDLSDITRLIHLQLKRVGCDPGTADAAWTPGSRKAVESFNQYAKASLEPKEASLETLDAVKAKGSRVCPVVCKTGQHADGDRCVADKKEAPKTASATPKEGASAARVVCGPQGCKTLGANCKVVYDPRWKTESAICN